jgi:hypothetical protein
VDLNLYRARHQQLHSFLFLHWVPLLRSSVSLNGTILRKQRVLSASYDLDTATAIRITGDNHGGVVLQAHWNDHPAHFTLPLMRNDHWGIASISADAAEALGRAVDVIDVRDDTVVDIRPQDDSAQPLKLSHAIRASAHGRRQVAELLYAHAEYARDHEDLSDSPLAALRFTSALIAAAMANAYEQLPQSGIQDSTKSHTSAS